MGVVYNLSNMSPISVILIILVTAVHQSHSILPDAWSTADVSLPTRSPLQILSSSEPHLSDVIVKRINDTLDLTCGEEGDEVVWYLPEHMTQRRSEDTKQDGVQRSGLTITSSHVRIAAITPDEAGRYTCEVAPFTVSKYVVVQEPATKACALGGFSCGERCVLPLYVCDGHADCERGEDESAPVCGTARPCDGKLECVVNEVQRCISPAWCWREPGTHRPRHSCCAAHDRAEHPRLPEPRPQPDYGLIQSTIYTVTACALIFMVAAVLLVSAICKMHMKRAALRSLSPQYACRLPCYSRYEAVALSRQTQGVEDTACTPECASDLSWPPCREPAPPSSVERLLHRLTFHPVPYPDSERRRSDSITVRLGRLRVSLPRLRARRSAGPPPHPLLNRAELDMLREATDTYTLNGRTIRLLGAEIQCPAALGELASPLGVVGRVVSPPPYSARAAAAPDKTCGPPPQYLSREQLAPNVGPDDCNGNPAAPEMPDQVEPPPGYDERQVDDNANPV